MVSHSPHLCPVLDFAKVSLPTTSPSRFYTSPMGPAGVKNIPIPQMRKLRPREAKQLTQDYTASHWRTRCGVGSGVLIPRATNLLLACPRTLVPSPMRSTQRAPRLLSGCQDQREAGSLLPGAGQCQPQGRGSWAAAAR